MQKDSKQHPEHSRKLGRRNVLKTTGIALSTAVAGISAIGSATATGEISADMVKPGNPESTERFVRRTHELGETKEVIRAYQNLSDRQLDAVRDAVRRLTTFEFEVNEVSSSAIPVSHTATANRKIAGSKVHETSHTLEFDIHPGSGTLSDASNSSSGSAPAPLWHHKGLYSSYLGTSSGEAYSSRGHEFEHSIGGQVIIQEATVIDIEGDADGNFESWDTIISL